MLTKLRLQARSEISRNPVRQRLRHRGNTGGAVKLLRQMGAEVISDRYIRSDIW